MSKKLSEASMEEILAMDMSCCEAAEELQGRLARCADLLDDLGSHWANWLVELFGIMENDVEAYEAMKEHMNKGGGSVH
jgi:hypothetical protein